MSKAEKLDHVSVELATEVFEHRSNQNPCECIAWAAIHGEVMTSITKGDLTLFVLMTSEQLDALVSQLAGSVAAVVKANTTGPGTVQ